MERIERETDRLQAVVDNLQYLSRLEQGRIAVHLADVNLNRLAAEYVSDRMPLAHSRELRLEISLQPDLPLVAGDPEMIGQALSILLTNALHYTPAGGIVTVRTRQKQTEGKRWAGLEVSDTGPGIQAEELASIFERFYRGQAGRTSGAAGTGLGLAIAREIVERHDGDIEVSSTGIPGEGATFTLWLPVADGTR
jgi:signal transduction histidine kinase